MMRHAVYKRLFSKRFCGIILGSIVYIQRKTIFGKQKELNTFFFNNAHFQFFGILRATLVTHFLCVLFSVWASFRVSNHDRIVSIFLWARLFLMSCSCILLNSLQQSIGTLPTHNPVSLVIRGQDVYQYSFSNLIHLMLHSSTTLTSKFVYAIIIYPL